MSSWSACGFMTEAAQSGGNATENKGQPGVALAGTPGQQDDVRTTTYPRQGHEFFGREAADEQSDDERVPSAGWREVYGALGVDDGGRRP